MTEQEVMQKFLDCHGCPNCGQFTMTLTLASRHTLWKWKCLNCGRTGNVGYDLHEIPRIDLPPDKEKELRSGTVENYREFLDKYGIVRPKTHILLDQDPSLY
jgi:predicted RNA-binding Zn-ribbon protein involved in translation (DUF1610 family)